MTVGTRQSEQLLLLYSSKKYFLSRSLPLSVSLLCAYSRSLLMQPSVFTICLPLCLSLCLFPILCLSLCRPPAVSICPPFVILLLCVSPCLSPSLSYCLSQISFLFFSLPLSPHLLFSLYLFISSIQMSLVSSLLPSCVFLQVSSHLCLPLILHLRLLLCLSRSFFPFSLNCDSLLGLSYLYLSYSLSPLLSVPVSSLVCSRLSLPPLSSFYHSPSVSPTVSSYLSLLYPHCLSLFVTLPAISSTLLTPFVSQPPIFILSLYLIFPNVFLFYVFLQVSSLLCLPFCVFPSAFSFIPPCIFPALSFPSISPIVTLFICHSHQ